ncbi:MAG: DNA repair protein RadC [Firmicutes bacterium]|nr:DNA repair protein RadC [Bacillota bacterium]
MEYRYTLKDLPANCRPRERLAQYGPQSLSNSELLAILLRTGTPTETVLELANQLLAQPKGLRFLAEASVEELSAYRGIGLAKATQIKAAVELGRRVASVSPEIRPVIKSPQDVSLLVMDDMRFLDREHFRTIALNSKNQVVGIDTISIGSLNSSLVHPRELFRTVISRSAAAIVLVHNHPSGDPSPSREDLEVTRRIVEVGKLLGVEVLDHIIIGDGCFISLKEKGIIS